MTWKKWFRVFLAFLYILLAVLAAGAVIRIYLAGASGRAAGDVLSAIFTREGLAREILRIAPLFFIAVAAAAAGRILKVSGDRPPEESRKAARGAETENALPRPVFREDTPRLRAAVRVAVSAAAVLMILAGIRNGSMREVLIKAINLCTECIGLG